MGSTFTSVRVISGGANGLRESLTELHREGHFEIEHENIVPIYTEDRVLSPDYSVGKGVFVHLVAVFIFIVSSNLDNLVIGLSYGLKGITIGLSSNLVIGLITFAGTVLSMTLGKSLLYIIPLEWATAMGSGLIILIGIYFILSYVGKRKKGNKKSEWPQENPEKFDRDQSKTIDLREAAALGAALSINNVGLGIGASIMGLNVPITSLGSCLCSLLCLCLGNKLGRSWLSRVVGTYAEPISGVLILLMGLWELLN